MKELVVIPLYNEEDTVASVLAALRQWYDGDILVIDDGSTDDSLKRITVLCLNRLFIAAHSRNAGYGASLRTGFSWARINGYSRMVTIDCDWQHEPCLVPSFFSELNNCDIVSGSRYLTESPQKGLIAPTDRKAINMELTQIINTDIGLNITDSFCGFKAYGEKAISNIDLKEDGYASPLELWAQVKKFDLKLKELPVPLIYLDPKRSFGGQLDNSSVRRTHYLEVWSREKKRWEM